MTVEYRIVLKGGKARRTTKITAENEAEERLLARCVKKMGLCTKAKVNKR